MALALGLALTGCVAGAPSRTLTADQHNDLGVTHFERGEPRAAAREFERAVALRPDWARALVNLGDARLALGEVEGAILAYERAVRAAAGHWARSAVVRWEPAANVCIDS